MNSFQILTFIQSEQDGGPEGPEASPPWSGAPPSHAPPQPSSPRGGGGGRGGGDAVFVLPAAATTLVDLALIQDPYVSSFEAFHGVHEQSVGWQFFGP